MEFLIMKFCLSIEKEKFHLKSDYDLDSGYFDSVNFQLAYGDYSHTEEAGHEGRQEMNITI